MLISSTMAVVAQLQTIWLQHSLFLLIINMFKGFCVMLVTNKKSLAEVQINIAGKREFSVLTRNSHVRRGKLPLLNCK